MKIVNWLIDTMSKEEHSLYIQRASGTLGVKNGGLSPEPVLGVSCSCHLRTPSLVHHLQTPIIPTMDTGRWKNRWKIRDLLAYERCSRVVLDFLSSTDVGRRVPAEEEDALSAVSELEEWEWLEEQRAGTEEPDVGGEPLLFLHTPDFMASVGTA